MEIICVTNRLLCEEDFLVRIEKIAQSGVNKIILREKDLEYNECFQLAKKCLEICEKYNVDFVINSQIKVAKDLCVKNIHLPLHILRDNSDLDMAIGTSVHSVEEAKEGERLGAKYLIAGHVFKTDCKRGLEPRGLDFLKEIVDSVSIPVYGIGGIDYNNAKEVMETGVKGVCIMSAFMKGEISRHVNFKTQ